MSISLMQSPGPQERPYHTVLSAGWMVTQASQSGLQGQDLFWEKYYNPVCSPALCSELSWCTSKKRIMEM